MLAHPDEPLSHAGRAALGLGIALGLLSVVLARYRIVHVIAWERIGGMVAAPVAVIVFRELDAMWLLAVIVAILIAVLSIESYRLRVVRRQIRSGGPRISTRDHKSGS